MILNLDSVDECSNSAVSGEVNAGIVQQHASNRKSLLCYSRYAAIL